MVIASRRLFHESFCSFFRSRLGGPSPPWQVSVNDTEFIHVDFSGGKRLLAWVRGRPGIDDPIVVVANFSGTGTWGPRYDIPRWPETPVGKHWHEFTQDRDVPADWIGAEPMYPWEAKIYGLAP